MRIVITGSRGFVGKRLVDRLKSKADILEFDVQLNPEMDIINKEHIFKFLSETEPDVVVHLAANANTVKAKEDPYFDFKINALGTLNLLDYAAKKNMMLIFASSAYIYGEPMFVPITEEHPKNPNHPYGVSKFVAENYIEVYNKLFGLNYTILRFFNIFGPGQNIGYVIPDFIYKAIKLKELGEKKFIVNSSPNVVRDFIYIHDVIDALENAIFNNPLNTSINICSGVPIKIGTLAQYILKIMNLDDVEIMFSQDIQGKLSVLYGSYEKAYKMLNWKPKTDLYEGLKKTVEFMLRKYSRMSS